MQQDQAHLPTMAPRLTITVEEAAVALGISRTLAYEALHRGELPFIRIGRRILIPALALDELLQSHVHGDQT